MGLVGRWVDEGGEAGWGRGGQRSGGAAGARRCGMGWDRSEMAGGRGLECGEGAGSDI